MSAVRVARAATRRDRIIKFQGCYHGHADAFLVQAGSGALTFGTPDSPGVTKGASGDTLVASYNDLASVKQSVRRQSRSHRGRHRRTDRRQHGRRPAGRRVSCRPARRVHGQRRAADLRRGDLGIPRLRRRRAEDARHPPRSHLPGQDHRRRSSGRRVRRTRRPDGPGIALGSGLPGRHAVGQSARDDRGHLVSRSPLAEALSRSRLRSALASRAVWPMPRERRALRCKSTRWARC